MSLQQESNISADVSVSALRDKKSAGLQIQFNNVDDKYDDGGDVDNNNNDHYDHYDHYDAVDD